MYLLLIDLAFYSTDSSSRNTFIRRRHASYEALRRRRHCWELYWSKKFLKVVPARDRIKAAAVFVLLRFKSSGTWDSLA